LRVIDPATATNVDLKDIRIVKKVGGTIDDTELIDGLVLTQNVVKSSGGPSRIEKAKIGLIQFQLSPPKPDVRDIFSLISFRFQCFYLFINIILTIRWRIKSSLMIIDLWIKF
jgi:T-complex protein 1 subunit delta